MAAVVCAPDLLAGLRTFLCGLLVCWCWCGWSRLGGGGGGLATGGRRERAREGAAMGEGEGERGSGRGGRGVRVSCGSSQVIVGWWCKKQPLPPNSLTHNPPLAPPRPNTALTTPPPHTHTQKPYHGTIRQMASVDPQIPVGQAHEVIAIDPGRRDHIRSERRVFDHNGIETDKSTYTMTTKHYAVVRGDARRQRETTRADRTVQVTVPGRGKGAPAGTTHRQTSLAQALQKRPSPKVWHLSDFIKYCAKTCNIMIPLLKQRGTRVARDRVRGVGQGGGDQRGGRGLGA